MLYIYIYMCGCFPDIAIIFRNASNILNTPSDALTLYPESISWDDFSGKSFPFTAWGSPEVPSNPAWARLLGTSRRSQALNRIRVRYVDEVFMEMDLLRCRQGVHMCIDICVCRHKVA